MSEMELLEKMKDMATKRGSMIYGFELEEKDGVFVVLAKSFKESYNNMPVFCSVEMGDWIDWFPVSLIETRKSACYLCGDIGRCVDFVSEKTNTVIFAYCPKCKKITPEGFNGQRICEEHS